MTLRDLADELHAAISSAKTTELVEAT